jgi:hypothetical protein
MHAYSALLLLCGHLADLIDCDNEIAASGSRPASSSSSSAASSASGSSSDSASVEMNADGLPLRPGVENCRHYMQERWCIFKNDPKYCPFNHPQGHQKEAEAALGAYKRVCCLQPASSLL